MTISVCLRLIHPTMALQPLSEPIPLRDVNHSRSIAFDGANIHVSDVNDDNFRVVAVPTAGGAQTVLRTYEVTDIGNPRGMTGIPVTTTTQANLTITTTHGDIYAGQSVTFADCL